MRSNIKSALYSPTHPAKREEKGDVNSKMLPHVCPSPPAFQTAWEKKGGEGEKEEETVKRISTCNLRALVGQPSPYLFRIRSRTKQKGEKKKRGGDTHLMPFPFRDRFLNGGRARGKEKGCPFCFHGAVGDTGPDQKEEKAQAGGNPRVRAEREEGGKKRGKKLVRAIDYPLLDEWGRGKEKRKECCLYLIRFG